MMIKNSIRRLSTSSIVDKFVNIFQTSTQDDRQMKINHFIQTYLQHEETVYPNLINDIIHRWAIEQPTKEALWTCKPDSNQCQKLTFNDIYNQSSRIANVLTENEFNLTSGKTVLVILPDHTPERIIIQLACLKSGLIFCPYDPKDLTDVGILERIQKLAIDCIITNEDNLEIARKYTHNPLRPLKKGLITNCSTYQPLPVGWNHLMQSANNAESQYTKVIHNQSNTPVIRILSNDNKVINYSQQKFNFNLILSAFWVNIDQTSRLIWMKNPNEIISIAPWIFGSAIFSKDTENLETMLKTCETHPIDTLCASSTSYELLENRQQENKTQLKQLFSTELIDPTIETRWYSLTNLHIRDDYADICNKSMLAPALTAFKQETHSIDQEYSLQRTISSEKFAAQYATNTP